MEMNQYGMVVNDLAGTQAESGSTTPQVLHLDPDRQQRVDMWSNDDSTNGTKDRHFPVVKVDTWLRLNARSASARGVGFALGFSFFVNIQLIGGQTKALDQQNMYSDLYSVYS